MRIDAMQPQALNSALSQNRAEGPGEREADGDWDDMNVSAARTPASPLQASSLQPPATQVSAAQSAVPSTPQAAVQTAAALPQGMGTKVDLFA